MKRVGKLKAKVLARQGQQYFNRSLTQLAWKRSSILIALVFAESVSSTILENNKEVLGSLIIFLPMLISTGGNASNQTSALAIEGMASGEIERTNLSEFFRREIITALIIAVSLGAAGFVRVRYLAGTSTLGSLAVSLTLSTIILISTLLGSTLPFLLRRAGIDPAFSVGPFLATIMDIIGILIFCFAARLILL